MDDRALIAELEPTVEVLLERHLAGAKEWFPHEYVPWSRGRDFVEGEAWDPQAVDLDRKMTNQAFNIIAYFFIC